MGNKINKYNVRLPNMPNTAKCSNMGPGGHRGCSRPLPIPQAGARALVGPPFRARRPPCLVGLISFGSGFQALVFWPRGSP